MHSDSRLRDAMAASVTLLERGENTEALKLLDESIADAVREHRVQWVRTLCHHAAIVARSNDDLPLAKHYYEQSLANEPENARALYGLAAIALDQGELETARQYAARCHAAIVKSDDETFRQGLLDLVLKHWPDLAKS